MVLYSSLDRLLPRSYLAKGTAGMKERVVQACRELRSEGTSLLA